MAQETRTEAGRRITAPRKDRRERESRDEASRVSEQTLGQAAAALWDGLRPELLPASLLSAVAGRIGNSAMLAISARSGGMERGAPRLPPEETDAAPLIWNTPLPEAAEAAAPDFGGAEG